MKKSLTVSLIMGMLMLFSAALTMAMKPSATIAGQSKIDLEAMIPSEFNNWKIDTALAPPLVNPEVTGEISKIYSQTLSRTYINTKDERVMLSIAYGSNQSTDLHVHRPEVCYQVGGFDSGKITKTFVDTTVGRIPVMHLVAKLGARNEPITYWIRMGDTLTRGWMEQKMASFTYGLTGKVPDGLLFRVSTISNDEQDSYRIQQEFLSAILQAVPAEDRYLLVGRMAL